MAGAPEEAQRFLISWPRYVKDDKTRFSQFLENALSDGPQNVTKRSKEAAAPDSAELRGDLKGRTRPSLKDLLLSPQGRTNDLVATRRPIRLRAQVKLDW